MDDVRVIHGDCLAVLPTLEAGSVDAIVTDPPYKLSQEYSSGTDADNLLAVSAIWEAASACRRVVKPGGLFAMFYDSRILPLAVEAMRHHGWKYLRHLVLYRRWGQASLVSGWMSTSDFVLLYVAPGGKAKFYGEARHDVYVKDGPEPDYFGHPAQKPLDCVKHIISRICPPGGTVLDPFAGSGTTGVAASIEGRKAILIESHAPYIDAIRRRLRDHEPLFRGAS